MPDIEITKECRTFNCSRIPPRTRPAALAKRQRADAGRCGSVEVAATGATARRANLGLHYPRHHNHLAPAWLQKQQRCFVCIPKPDRVLGGKAWSRGVN